MINQNQNKILSSTQTVFPQARQQAKNHKESRPSDASKQEATAINNHARKKTR